MAGGPDNFNHNKMSHLFKWADQANNAYWFTATEGPLSLLSAPRIHENCVKGCEIRGLHIQKGFRFNYSKTEDPKLCPRKRWVLDPFSQPVKISTLGNPEVKVPFDPETLYISGASGCCSILRWEKEWWAVFGIYKRSLLNGEWIKITVIHNLPLLPVWLSAPVEQIRQEIFAVL